MCCINYGGGGVQIITSKCCLTLRHSGGLLRQSGQVEWRQSQQWTPKQHFWGCPDPPVERQGEQHIQQRQVQVWLGSLGFEELLS